MDTNKRSITYKDFTDQIVTATWAARPIGHLQIRDQQGNKVGNEPLMSAERFDSWAEGMKRNFPDCIVK